MRPAENRASPRIELCAPARVFAGDESFPVEILDLCNHGIGFSAAKIPGSVPKDVPIRVEAENLLTTSVHGQAKGWDSKLWDRANRRIGGILAHTTHHDHLAALVEQFVAPVLPFPRASRGFRRAWPQLTLAQRRAVSDLLARLVREDARTRVWALNLTQDENVPATNLQSLLPVLAERTLDAIGIDDLIARIRKTREEFLAKDNRSTRLPEYIPEQDDQLLGRFVTQGTMVTILARGAPDGSPPPEKVVALCLADDPDALDVVQNALLLPETRASFGRSGDLVWCTPFDDIDFRASTLRIGKREIVRAMSPALEVPEDSGCFLFRYQARVARPIFKPFSSLRLEDHCFRISSMYEDTGQTVGSIMCPPLPELTHSNVGLDSVSREDFELRPWRYDDGR